MFQILNRKVFIGHWLLIALEGCTLGRFLESGESIY